LLGCNACGKRKLRADSGAAMSKFQRVMAARRMKFLWLAALLLAVTLGQRSGLAAETRFALVIGNDEYKSAKLATPANDAGWSLACSPLRASR
jgi:hypothetical protein